jgi:hypothetical protein
VQALAEAAPLAEQAEAAGDLSVLTEARSIQIHLAAQRGIEREPEAVELLLADAPRRGLRRFRTPSVARSRSATGISPPGS